MVAGALGVIVTRVEMHDFDDYEALHKGMASVGFARTWMFGPPGRKVRKYLPTGLYVLAMPGKSIGAATDMALAVADHLARGGGHKVVSMMTSELSDAGLEVAPPESAEEALGQHLGVTSFRPLSSR